MTEDYILDKMLNNSKMIIGAEKFDNTKKLVNTYDKLADEVT